ncbi:MAG TPA: ATP-binding protein [Candidatus Polarisedimenticolia bacterium]|nr:ATP-binding protein [Candidatus Polarisedimenticolia bacterium]
MPIPKAATRGSPSQNGVHRVDPEARQAQYEALFEILPHPVWVLDRATLRFLAANLAAVEHFGYTREALLGMTFPDLHSPEEAMTLRQRLQRSGAEGSSTWRHRTGTGKMVLTRVTWLPIGFDRIPGILMVADATPQPVRQLVLEVEKSRARLQAVSWQLVRLQERQREEIARELHDEVGQLLTGLKFILATREEAERSGGAGPAVHLDDQPMAIVNELMARVRNLSMDLRPPMLEEMGLVPTLEWYFHRFTSRNGVQVTFHQDIGRTRYPDEIEITAFRIVQESLTNVARHAAIDEVQVILRDDREGLWVRIEDRGRGFLPNQVRGVSAGLIGMNERARLVGGQFTIDSTVGAGTRIAVVLPLAISGGGLTGLEL